MSFKFVTVKELKFIESINREFLQNRVGQAVFYYAIDPEENDASNVYGEKIRKTWRAPVRLNCLVNYGNPTSKSTNEGLDSDYELECYCLTQELIERNLKPSEGDFVEFAQVFFEVTSVTQPQLVFGQANEKIMTKLMCAPAREGQFAAGSTSKDLIDNTHPVEPTRAKKLEGS